MPATKTYNQLKRIWATANQIGLDEEQLRDLVEEETGQRHISALSKRQAAAVIDRLSGSRGRLPHTPGGASIEQVKKIFKLGYLVFSGDDTEEHRAESHRRLRGWIRHMSRGLWWNPSDLSDNWASKVIESLRALAQRNGIVLSE